ncbi:MAG: DUF4197 domain-containing protein [Sneathiella sp.]
MRPFVLKLFCVLVLCLGPLSVANADLLKGLQDTLNKAVSPSDGASTSSSGTSLGVAKITEGLKEALKVGAESVTSQIGAKGGYENDPAIHIPLPKKMQQAQSYLRKFGMSDLADEVEVKLNEGAEAAAPKTKELIWKSITDMTVEDAKKIYDGADDAATQYFKKVASADLKKVISPVIDKSLTDVGAFAAYDKLIADYKQYPLVPDIQSDLTAHATNQALEGLFHYLAQEEAAIRNNPVKRTTEILQSVFGR